MAWTLICIAGDAVPERLVIDTAIDIGRDPHCDVRIRDERASRFHARLCPDSTVVSVTDLNSANGTWSGQQRISGSAQLSDGAVLGVGNATFVLSDSSGNGGSVSDDGQRLTVTSQHATRVWQPGDAPEVLPQLHGVLRRVAAAPLHDRGDALARHANQLIDADRFGVVLRGRVSGTLSQRLANRLATGSSARLWQLGRDLAGATIAAEAVGAALTAPLGEAAHLIAIRGHDREPFTTADLDRLAVLAGEVSTLLPQPEAVDTSQLVGSSPPMQALRQRISRIAASDTTVLITGESGTGKELVAQAVHANSARAAGPLITVNCAAVAESLFEAELFGHERGAFTGADQARPGRIRRADGGTLFLDEIGELPLSMQAKLLRVLQQGEVEPVGGGASVTVDIRVIAATNRDLSQEVEAGRFREDLFYRLDVLRLRTPSLQERSSDIPDLIRHLAAVAAEDLGVSCPVFSAAAIAHLQANRWPGNVRQLANMVTRCVALADQAEIGPDDLDLDTQAQPLALTLPLDAPFPSLAEVELAHVHAALVRCEWNRSQAARLLGISRPTLLKKITDNGLRPSD